MPHPLETLNTIGSGSGVGPSTDNEVINLLTLILHGRGLKFVYSGSFSKERKLFLALKIRYSRNFVMKESLSTLPAYCTTSGLYVLSVESCLVCLYLTTSSRQSQTFYSSRLLPHKFFCEKMQAKNYAKL